MNYEMVGASTTKGYCKGKKGDVLQRVVVIPLSATPGTVSIQDGTDASFIIYKAADAIPRVIDLHVQCTGAGWTVITGANVQCIVVGD